MIKPLRGAQLDKAHPINRGLKCHLLVNEGDGKKVFDLSGNGNLGTLHNMAFPSTAVSGWNAGRKGVGLKFDGTDDYVDCGNSNSIDFTTGSFTISLWIKTTTGDNKTLIDKGHKGWITVYKGYAINLDAGFGNGIPFFSISDGTTRTIKAHTQSIHNGLWHHVVAIRNIADDKLYLYVDNNSVSETDNSGDISNSAMVLRIGNARSDINNFPGQIDQVRIYNRALSAEEIKTLYLYPYVGFQQPCTAWLYAAAAGGLSIPVAMHHYRGLRV